MLNNCDTKSKTNIRRSTARNIGLENSDVNTRKSIGFGSKRSSLMARSSNSIDSKHNML